METLSRYRQPGWCRIGNRVLRRVCVVCLLAYAGLCLVGCRPSTSYGDGQAAIDDAYMALAVVLTSNDGIEATNETNVTNSEQHTKRVLYFTADWCGPCVRWKNEELPKLVSVGWEDRIEIIDVDQNSELASQYMIGRRVPTFVVVENGREIGRRMGTVDASVFAGWVNQL